MRYFCLTITFLLIALNLQSQRDSQLTIKTIIPSKTTDGFYLLPYSYKGISQYYLNAVNKKSEVVYNYKLDIPPLEIRESTDKNHLIIAGGIRSNTAFYLLDTLYNIKPIDLQIKSLGNVLLDPHDFQFLENGNLLAFAPTPDTTDVSYIISGGNPNAAIIHFSIYEIDTAKNEVVHQWNSKDHFSITETGDHIDLRSKSLDYIHLNSIQYIPEERAILTSSRDMSEITKIKWPEGNIIWRLGGKCNEFNFVNDPYGFSGQHQARMHKDTLILFNNSTFSPHKQSSVAIYLIDEKSSTARLLNRHYGNDVNFTKRRGGVTLLENGNYLVSWGQNINLDHNFSELSNTGETVEKGYYYNVKNYRVNKTLWHPKLLQIARDKNNVLVKNQSKFELNLNGIFYEKPSKLENKLETIKIAKTLSPNESISIQVSQGAFQKGAFIEYEFEDLFYVRQYLIP